MATRKLIGTDPDQVPVNGDLGTLAFQDSESVRVTNLRVDGDLTVDGERMRIDSAGNVGIGTSSPGAKLTVKLGNIGIDQDEAPQQFFGAGGNVAGTNTTGGVLTVFGHAPNAFGDTSTPPYDGTNFVGAAGLMARGFSESAQYRGSLEFFTKTASNANATSRMIITHDGNVGIGTSSPLGKLKVAVGDNAPAASGNMNTGVIYESGVGSRAINFGVNNTAGYSWINAAFSNNSGVADNLVLMTGATERLRIDASGHLIVPAGITLGTAAGVYGAANTLDDYEEGTWTPTLGGDATYTSQAGTYTKVGRLVIANCILAVNIIGTGATNNVSGLPFTVRSQAQGFGGTPQYFENLANNVVLLNPSPNAGATTITFLTLAAAGGTTSYNTALWQNSTRIDFTVMYFT
jgi:hypothetical protein